MPRSNVKSVRGRLCTISVLAPPIRVASDTLGKNSPSFSMRLTKKLLFEEGLFLYFLTLILPNAFKPERERKRYISRYLAWWCVVRYFALLRQKNPVCVISCEQESVPGGERWFHLERNCSALCKRPSFRQEVSETCFYIPTHGTFGKEKALQLRFTAKVNFWSMKTSHIYCRSFCLM